jgi:hypothetical protein
VYGAGVPDLTRTGRRGEGRVQAAPNRQGLCGWGRFSLGELGLDTQSHPRVGGGPFLSVRRWSMQAGPATRQAGVRAITMVHLVWAPGLPIQRQTITTLQPPAQRPPGAEDQGLASRWATGVGFPAWGAGQTAWRGRRNT